MLVWLFPSVLLLRVCTQMAGGQEPRVPASGREDERSTHGEESGRRGSQERHVCGRNPRPHVAMAMVLKHTAPSTYNPLAFPVRVF